MKYRSQHNFKINTLLIALIISIPSNLFANIPVPSLFGLGAPFFLSMDTIGIIFALIILIESSIIYYGLKKDFIKILAFVLVMNLASSLIGLLISYSSAFTFIFLISLPFILDKVLKKHTQLGKISIFLISILSSVLIIFWAGLTFNNANGVKLWCLYGSLIPAFILSWQIEYPILIRFIETEKILKFTILANVASYCMLLLYMVIFSYTILDNPTLDDSYLTFHAKNFAQQGNVEKTIKLINMTHKLNAEKPISRYIIEDELWIVQKLHSKGHTQEAKLIFEDLKILIPNGSNLSEETNLYLKDTENLLSQ